MPAQPFMISLFLFALNVAFYAPGELCAQDPSWPDKLCTKIPSLCEGLPPDMIPWAPALTDTDHSTVVDDTKGARKRPGPGRYQSNLVDENRPN
jgi:hypothetical protein